MKSLYSCNAALRFAFALLISSFACAQAPLSKLTIALAEPQVSIDIAASDLLDFKQIVAKDLEESELFTILDGPHPLSTDQSSYGEWIKDGADWLMKVRISSKGKDEFEVIVELMDVRRCRIIYTKKYVGMKSSLIKFAHAIARDTRRQAP